MSPNTSVLVNFRIKRFSKFLLCYCHFHYDGVVIIVLHVSTTNCTICHHLKIFLYMIYILSYYTDNPPQEE